MVVGEDAGSTKNLVYVHSSSVFKETYNKADDQWTWSRKVISDGQEVVLTEVGDGLSELGEMDQHKWYQVKYDADGNVVSADVANDALLGANGYVDNYVDIATAVDAEDDVLYTSLAPEIHSEDLELRGRTLWLDTDLTKGFRVAEDVNVALIQWNNNTENTYFDSGVKSLESIVDDLNDRHYDNSEGDTEHDYVISAIIERGVATSVVIWDKSQICDPYSEPDWGTSDLDDVYKVELSDALWGGIVMPYFYDGTYDEDVAVDAIYQELVDQGYDVLDVVDNGGTYTFQTKRGVVSKDFTWKVGYYENVYAVGNVTCDEVTSGAPASVNVKYLVPGETVTFTYDRGDTWKSGSYSTASFTVGGQIVSNDTPVTINGEVATTTFTVPDSIANGDVVCDSIDA